jgi:hypothetical protein
LGIWVGEADPDTQISGQIPGRRGSGKQKGGFMATISGQKTVATHGTAEQLHAGLVVNGAVMVKALAANTGLVYIGQVAGDVSSANGMPLTAGEVAIFSNVGNLAEVWVDAAVDGEGVAWLLLSV